MPSHGGGKRFAVEQELVSASARAALRSFDFSKLAGHSARIVFASMGDEGGGNLTGGRLTLDGLLGGNYQTGPTTRTTDPYGPVARSATTGWTGLLGFQSLSDGPTDYQSIGFVNPGDEQFLSALIATELLLAGVQVEADPKHPVDVVVIVLVDVFGTIRDRTDYLFYNRERLRARTALEIVAVRRRDGAVVLPAQRGAAEATWAQNFVLWTGPTSTTRSLRPIDDLLMPPLPAPRGGIGSPQWKADDEVAPKTSPGPSKPPPSNTTESPPELPNTLTRPDTRPRTNPPFE